MIHVLVFCFHLYRRSEVNRDDDERCGPIIMLRNLKDSVRKEDVSFKCRTVCSLIVYEVASSQYFLCLAKSGTSDIYNVR